MSVLWARRAAVSNTTANDCGSVLCQKLAPLRAQPPRPLSPEVTRLCGSLGRAPCSPVRAEREKPGGGHQCQAGGTHLEMPDYGQAVLL